MKKTIMILLTLVLALSLTACGESGKYEDAMSLYESGQYHEAAEKFAALGDYEDSAEMAQECTYEEATALYESGDLQGALDAFQTISTYKGAAEKIEAVERDMSLQAHSDVVEALAGETWFFNGGEDTILNGISFDGGVATITQVSYDGNGKHENGSTEHPFSIDDQNIVVGMTDGTELTIPYTLSGGTVTLGQAELRRP